MAMDSYQKLIEECESSLRAGRVNVVISLLKSLIPSKVPRNYRLPISRICRRCDQTTLGLKLLTSVIHPRKKGVSDPATDSEKSEYAALRLKIGSVDEALIILSRVDETKAPEAFMIRAYCHMAQWNYKLASQELKKYLALSPEPYPALIGRVNLAASLIPIGEFEEAFELLGSLIDETNKSGYHRLRANCYELRSQIYLDRQDFEKCESDLLSASEILDSQLTTDQLYIQKWLAVLEARKNFSQEPLLKIKKQAYERNNWETVRDMDFQLLKLKFDPVLFEYLLRGTPWEAYRERVCQSLGKDLSKHLSSEYRLGDQRGPVVDLRQTQLSKGHLIPGKQVHRLFVALLHDFYKPISVGALYANVFPGEYYNVFSSAGRVHQCLYRGRMWLKDHQLPAEIEEIDGRFHFRIIGPMSFLLGSSAQVLDQNSVLMERLRNSLASVEVFSSSEVAKAVELSQASAVRFLSWAIENGHIEKVGSGRASRYLFT